MSQKFKKVRIVNTEPVEEIQADSLVSFSPDDAIIRAGGWNGAWTRKENPNVIYLNNNLDWELVQINNTVALIAKNKNY
jgi:hypothetical protein